MTREDYLQAAIGVLKSRYSESRIRQILDLIPESKLEALSIQQLTQVVPVIADLDQGKPYGISIRKLTSEGPSADLIEILLTAFDFPGLFSALSGILSASGFETRQGTIITTGIDPATSHRMVIDILSGSIGPDLDFDLWAAEVEQVFDRLFDFYREHVAGDESALSRVKQLVIEEVAAALSRADIQPGKIMSPMTITQKEAADMTRFEISSTDTPFFLYSLASALLLHKVSIEGLEIRTEGDRVLDMVDLTDANGRAIQDEQLINRIRLSILLSKQFTYFVDRAPDPLRALERFDQLVQDIGEVRSAEDIHQFLASAAFQRELALVLGTSDFLWEDFIRVQHENILPMIRSIGENQLLSTGPDEIGQKISRQLDEAAKKVLTGKAAAMDPLEALQLSLAAQVQTLNEIKNRESFLIDLDHILVRELDFFFLSRRLTALAEAVVCAAVQIAWQELVPRHGIPRTAAGLEAEWAVFGLGKLGGRALGYASDIELLFVFSDNGSTDGRSRLANREFFERLFRSAATKITARREGIFKVDLRLRPHGEDGPVAVKLQSFIDYFGREGGAHSAERLALVRLRWIGGSKELGTQVTRLRDHIIYEEDSIKIPELRALRKRQLEEKAGDRDKGGKARINAKFSPGTLVDLEYNVQILQIIHGRLHPDLRVPGIHQALKQLSRIGTIDSEEAEAMMAAYQFFRKLINGLRMLRGNAADLFLPEESELEYRYLARRIGYKRTEERTEAEQLRIDFEMHSAGVRRFVERHLGRDAIPVEAAGSVVDLIISDSLSDGVLARVMQQGGFKNPQRALVNLKSLAGDAQRQASFIQLIVLVWDVLAVSPDPDMALNNWEQFVRRLESPIDHYKRLLSQPKRIRLLLTLFAVSQFLSDTLIQNPSFFNYITDPRIVGKAKDQIGFEEDLRREAESAADRFDWLNRLRRFRKREILRIGLRDLGLRVRIQEVMGEISFLARACCEVALEQVWQRLVPAPRPEGPGLDRLVICGFGKLGGWELNYSSDIDLVAIYLPREESRTEEEEQTYTRVVKGWVQDLTDFTQEGQAYRVDLRLRPYGASGPLVSTLKSIVEYYDKQAELWEIQALIKLRPVAGNLSLGEIFLDEVKEHFIRRWDSMTVRSNIAKMRDLGLQQHTSGLDGRVDVKNGRGGIRDIEFLVQGMQLIHCREFPEILKGNTLRSLVLLEDKNLVAAEEAKELSQDYQFLRAVEHYLQVADDRQLHALPEDAFEKDKLARFLFHYLGTYRKEIPPKSRQSEVFYQVLTEVMARVRSRYEQFIYAKSS